MKARSKRSRKPGYPKDRAARLHVSGASKRQIAKILGVGTETVASMVEDSDFMREYRRRLRGRVERSLAALDKALGDGKRKDLRLKAALWTLENTQIGVKKIEKDVYYHDEFDGKIKEELEYYALHGYWPSNGEKKGRQ